MVFMQQVKYSSKILSQNSILEEKKFNVEIQKHFYNIRIYSDDEEKKNGN